MSSVHNDPHRQLKEDGNLSQIDPQVPDHMDRSGTVDFVFPKLVLWEKMSGLGCRYISNSNCHVIARSPEPSTAQESS
jgi:hypothetical protein